MPACSSHPRPVLQTRLQPEVQKLALDVEYIVSVPSAGPRDRDKAGHCSQPADLALEASCLHSLPPPLHLEPFLTLFLFFLLVLIKSSYLYGLYY